MGRLRLPSHAGNQWLAVNACGDGGQDLPACTLKSKFIYPRASLHAPVLTHPSRLPNTSLESHFLPSNYTALVSSCLPLASLLWPLSRAPWLSGLLHSCCVPVWSWGRPHPAFLEIPARPLTGTQMEAGLGGLLVADDGVERVGFRLRQGEFES